LGAGPARAEARDWVIVDVRRDAAHLVDERLTERLVALETADVDVPLPPSTAIRPPLYFRVFSPTPATLRIELWELGQPYGARNISASGTETLRARRIALAAGELTRQLRRRRLIELDALRRAEENSGAARRETALPIYGRFVLGAGAQAAAMGLGDAWFVGPSLDARLAFTSGQRVSLGAAWLEGGAKGTGRAARWFEVRLVIDEQLLLARPLLLDLGLGAAVASLRVDGLHDDGESGPFDTWSSRAGIDVRLEARLGRSFALAFGPDMGVVLHPVTARSDDGREHHLGGLWLGGAVTLELDPAGAP